MSAPLLIASLLGFALALRARAGSRCSSAGGAVGVAAEYLRLSNAHNLKGMLRLYRADVSLSALRNHADEPFWQTSRTLIKRRPVLVRSVTRRFTDSNSKKGQLVTLSCKWLPFFLRSSQHASKRGIDDAERVV